MHSFDKINEYVESVCQQIRWQKAHFRVSDELKNHITDGRDNYIKQGIDEYEATEKAILDTGDATAVGTEFDRVHRPKPQWEMFAWVAGFIMLGLFISMFVFSEFGIANRLFWTVIGAVIMIGAYFADFTLVGKYPRLVFVGIALFVIIMSPMIALNPFGVPIWINGIRDRSFMGLILSHAHLQSFALLLPIAFVPIIYIMKGKGYKGIILSQLAYGFLLLISYVTSIALSGFIHFAVIGMGLLLIAVFREWFGIGKARGTLLVVTPFVVIFALLLLQVHASMGGTRLAVLFNPHADPYGIGFTAIQIRQSLSDAVLWGEVYMPVFVSNRLMYSDFVLSTVIFRFGWLAFTAVMCAIIFFTVKIILRCVKQKSDLGFFVSLAVALTLSAQIFMYVIFNVGFLFTHISLPLISPGNFAMLINMGLIGLMLSVFRTGDVVCDKVLLRNDTQKRFIAYDDGKLTINFR